MPDMTAARRFVRHLDHVQLTYPPGAEETARAFYTGVLGAREIEKPVTLRGRGGLWVRHGSVEIHLGEERPQPASKRHPALLVNDLEAWRAHLAAHDVAMGEEPHIPGRQRFMLRDPFGNRIELMAYDPDPGRLQVDPVSLADAVVRLDPLEPGDVDALWAVAQDERIWPWMPAWPQSREDMASLVDTALDEESRGWGLPFTVRRAEDGAVVGSTRFLDIDPVHRSLEIGWTWLTPSVWRSAVNTAMKRLLLRHCFDGLGCERVFLKTDHRNERSQRAMERLGLVREGVFRRHRRRPDGSWRDTVYYSVTAPEWPGLRTHLETLRDRDGN